MLRSTLRKTGRPIAFYKNRRGERIDGLMRLGDGRWRASGAEKFTFTEPDEDLAILHFRRWQAANAGRTISLPVEATGLEPAAAMEMAATTQVEMRFAPGQAIRVSRLLDEAEFWATVRREILTRPHYCAEQTGIEQLAYLVDLPKPMPSPNLEEVGKLYLEHARVSDNWRAKCRLFWQEFRDLVEVATLREVNQQHLIDYAEVMLGSAKTPTYARQRFGAIKAIINYPTKRGKWAEDAKRVLALCAVLVPPRKSAVDPHPISRDAFHALYGAANEQMKAILLLALNSCMYGGEVAALDWSDVNLSKKTLTTSRQKTGIVRIATLWPRTVEALSGLPRTNGAIFLTSGTRMRHNYQTIYKLFKVTRHAAGEVASQAQLSHVRDGAYTACVEAGVELDRCKLLAGHATGISDHYVRRRPQMVASGCAAIEAAYFE